MAMAFFLVLSGLLAPVVPMVDAATISNINAAERAAALQGDETDPPPVDSDGDGIADTEDSCPDAPNLGSDWNGDGTDDACDPPPADSDNDGIPDNEDSCPNAPNTGIDSDSDDACDPPTTDTDGDGIADTEDSCPDVANTGGDWNGDGVDDACDPDPGPEQLGQGQVRVFKYGCEVVPPDDADLNWYLGNCQSPQNGVTFVLDMPDPEPDIEAMTGVPLGGGVQMTVNFGSYQLMETMPVSGYQTAAVFCTTSTSGVGLNPAVMTDAGVSNNSITVNVISAAIIYCHWYNEPVTDPNARQAGQNDTNYLIVYKHECVNGVQNSAPTNASHEENKTYFDAQCPTLAGWDFDAEFSDGSKELKRTGADGKSVWENVPLGDFLLWENISTEYGDPVSYCSVVESDNPAADMGWDDYEGHRDDDGQQYAAIWGRFNSDDRGMECHVYNFAPGISAEANLGNAEVHVTTHWCPPATDVLSSGDDSSMLKTACVEQGTSVTAAFVPTTATTSFDLTFPGPFPQTLTSPNTMSADTYTATFTSSTPPAGEALFCEFNPNQSNTKPYARAFSVSSTNYSVEFDPADVGHCDWFGVLANNVTPGYGDVLVNKFECAMTPPPNSAYAWYFQNCTTLMNGVTFVLDTPSVDIQTDTGDSINGAVMMGGVEAGNYPLTETVPATHTIGAVFCATIGMADIPGPGDFLMQAVNGSSITATVTADMLFYCNWYNVPVAGDGTSVTIYKWECPAGTMYGQPDSYYSAECATEQAGVPFEITDTVGTQQTTSDNNGRQIDGLMGQFTIAEIIQPGWGNPAIFCQLLNAGQTTDYSATSPSVTLPPSADDDYQCWFYNIPEDDTSVTIYKFECPEGTLYGQLDSYYSAECATEQPGVTFEVRDDNVTQEVTSDNNGRQVSGLVGQFRITEKVPTGYGNPVIFCQQLNDPLATNFTPTSPFATLNPSADDYQCWFYNIPDDGTSVTIYKWECPAGTMYGQPDSYYSAECATEQAGVPFEITDTVGTQQTTSDNNGRQIDGLMGQFTITEIIQPGWGNPAIFCQLLNAGQSTNYSATSPSVTLPPSYDDDYQCWFYNIPENPSTVTIYKWECPQGMPADKSQTWFETNCTTPMNDVTFELTDSKGPRSMDTANGMVQWTDVSTGAVQIKELIPPGYSPHPYVSCVLQNLVTNEEIPPTINGVWNTTVAHGGMTITCNWYNWYLGPGEITVYKWTCPVGYDRTAWGADPKMDCTEATDGITFKLDQPDPEVDLMSNTGDNISGAVYFGGLTPGTYVLTEMLDAGQMQDIFVWDCVGINTSSVHPTPLSVGQNLNFTIVGGDKIECHWFNVPYPDYGWIVVSKFNCTTEKYVSDVYCYTNQTGQMFDLQLWNGSSWTTVQSGTTDVSGKVGFYDLDAGEYKLVEPDGKACLMKSSNITSGGNIGGAVGAETTVYVYNCSTPPPPQTGKTPTKYPNTGVGPMEETEQRMPGFEIAGLLALAGLHMSRRRLIKGAAVLGLGGTIAVPLTRAQDLVPLDSTPVPGTPNPEVFGCATPQAGTPVASGTPEMSGTPEIDPCNRGAIPMQIRVPEINVDAAIEYLEIIDGQMQAPSGATDVTWYKETSRLGETGNGIYAGHLNYWGVPEGVFFRLESLQEGDIIEIDGDDQETYLYQVQWMQNFPSDEEPPEDALGFTDEAAITLITCGGEWITARAEYDHRTLVRAVLWEP